MLGLRAIGKTWGGIETHVQEISTRLAAQGHRVTVFCRGRYNEAGKTYQGVRLKNRPALYSKHLEAISHTFFCLPSVLLGYDLVHFHATGPSLLSWGPRLFGRKVVVTVHGLDFKRAKWGGPATMVLKAGAWTAGACPHRTIVVSRALRQYYKKRWNRETVYIPNGVNRPETRPLDKLGRFGLEKKGYVLSLGRLVPEKGAHYLIEAFRGLQTDLKLVVAGDVTHTGEYGKRLEQLAKDDPRIVFTGPLYGEEKDEAFSNARCFVLPSDMEGMPIVLLEAMSYGCPVLSSDIEECVSVAPKGANEVIATFCAGNVTSLAESLKRLLARDDLDEFGARGREFVLAEYDWDSIAGSTLEVYKGLVRN